MQIGELAQRFGVAPSKIRFLEAEGLVRPARRTQTGYREYDESSAEALAMILQAQSLGFTLGEIKGALTESRTNGLRHDYLIGQITQKLSELDRHIAQVQELRGRLICARDELKARVKNGIKCTGKTPTLPSGTSKLRAPRQSNRRSAS